MGRAERGAIADLGDLPGVGQGGDSGGLRRSVDDPDVLKAPNPRDDVFRGHHIAQPQVGKGVIFGY